MRNNIWLLAFTLFGAVNIASAQFNFKQHKVVKGDDVYSIAKEYGTTPEAIYELNPMAKNGIQPDTFIVLPNVIAPPEKHVEGITFKKHKTKSKETLYSVAKKYKVTVDDIKEHNEFLQKEPLRKGDIIKIPLPAPKTNKIVRKIGKKNEDIVKEEISKTKIYTIQPKDTRYGIARKFGLTIPELENMNPNLGDTFPIGTQILVAKEEAVSNDDEVLNDDNTFELYEVKPKETLYSLGKRYKIELDSIEVLNPYVKDGLKAGMILKMPNLFSSLKPGEEPAIVNLENNISNTSAKKIAVLLPFNIANVDFSDEEAVENHLKSRSVSLSADFYSGVLLAVERAKEKGISTTLEVCDTKKSDRVVQQIISQKDLKSFDAVIGPLFQKNVEKAASQLKGSGVTVLSPISSKVRANSKNFFQTRPTELILQDKLIAFAKKDSLTKKNIVIIADKKSSAIKQKLISNFPEAKILDPEEENFVKESKLVEVFGEEESEIPTWVFLETKNMGLISNVVPFLNARAKTHKVKLFTTEKSNAYESESILNLHLSNLNFHFPSFKNESTNSTKEKFIKSYTKKYGAAPNSYAIRGYDITYDLLLRLSVEEKVKSIANSQYVTEYVENKFFYVKNDEGGFTNRASYILCYRPGLEIEKVE